MCLAVPAKIVSIEGDEALVESRGLRFSVSLALVDNAGIGDYLIIHAGYALNVMLPEDADTTLRIMDRAGIGPGCSDG